MAETKKAATAAKSETKTAASSKTAAPKSTAAKTVAAKTAAPKTATKAAAPKAEAKPAQVVEAKTAPKSVAAKTEKKPAENLLKVILVKSSSGRLIKQQRTLEALGLGKLHSSHIVPDNAATRGMIFVVKHLVSVEKVK